jgi:hypothetical protein
MPVSTRKQDRAAGSSQRRGFIGGVIGNQPGVAAESTSTEKAERRCRVTA